MNKYFLLSMAAGIFVLTGCSSVGEQAVEGISGKNTNLDGYVFYGSGETVNSETAAPEAKAIIGRLTYKSRKVNIPKGTKTPNTGYFKSTRTKTLFGTEEQIIEYDFTASDSDTAIELQDKIQTGLKLIQPE